jgi:hypothetical protein
VAVWRARVQGAMERVEGRSLKSITAFLKEHAKKKFTLPADVEAEHAAEADEVIEEPLGERLPPSPAKRAAHALSAPKHVCKVP